MSSRRDARESFPPAPDHSLPSYAEPTPETHRRISRETEAELALKSSRFGRGIRPVIIVVFFLTIAAVPVLQLGNKLRLQVGASSRQLSPSVRLLSHTLPLAEFFNFKTFLAVPRIRDTLGIEKSLEGDSVISRRLLPWAQLALSYGRAGNEQVYFGSGGWLFYRPDVDYLTCKPFLDERQLAYRLRREAVQADPVRAIVDFGSQLRNRGIDLVVMPVPVKPSIETGAFCGRSFETALQNTSFEEFKRRLSLAKIRVFDIGPELARRKSAADRHDLYLRGDTHWRPETMEFVANRLAQYLGPGFNRKSQNQRVQEQVVSNVGDIAAMLKLPPNHQLFLPETVQIHQVAYATGKSGSAPEILLLGDSFSNIYSFGKMGWGDNAGLPEHLSLALGQATVDRIVRNSDGAFATREMLAHELARGRDRLAGKKIVIWEFAARELSFGNWKLIHLQAQHDSPVRPFSPLTREHTTVSGDVESVSTVPSPGSVPYPDHIMCIHLVNITTVAQSNFSANEAVIYLWSMRHNSWTEAAKLRPGDHVKMNVCRWSDVSSQYETFNRSELDDPALQLADPLWGELLK